MQVEIQIDPSYEKPKLILILDPCWFVRISHGRLESC